MQNQRLMVLSAGLLAIFPDCKGYAVISSKRRTRRCCQLNLSIKPQGPDQLIHITHFMFDQVFNNTIVNPGTD